MGIIEEIKQDASAIAILKDWIGGGTHVPVAQATDRALSCLSGNGGKPCPFHKAPGWWDTVKCEAAEVIKGQIALKSKMKLSTPYDDKMMMCSKCGCSMLVKPWVPIEHIKKHTPEDNLRDMPVWCWQRIEAETQ